MAGKPDEDGAVEFPYASLEAALKDDFRKIGGPESALKFLRQGYKQVEWRKRTERHRILREMHEDEQFAKEQARSGRAIPLPKKKEK